MFKRTVVIAVFFVGVIAALSGVAEAGCMTLSGGTRYCAAWITGSEICQVNIQGSINRDVDTVRCTASAIQGTSFCLNPASKSRKGALQGQAFNLTVPLSATSDIQTCTKNNGICSAAIELDPDPDTPGLCTNDNWVFVTLTAATFTGTVEVCPNGIVNPSAPVNDPNSPSSDLCGANNDPPLTMVENCTVDLAGYQPGDNRAYSCTCASQTGGCPLP
jgi:hypothetical protein